MQENTNSKLFVHAYDWTTEDSYTEDDHVAVHAWCLDRQSEPHLIRFTDFPAFCHVELPMYIGGRFFKWTAASADRFVNWLSMVLGEDRPEKGLFKMSKKIYYYRGNRTYPMLLLTFKSIAAMHHCESFLAQPRKVDDFGVVMCRVWETSISVIRKLLTVKNTRYSQWFSLDATLVPEEDRISSLQHEYIGHWRTLAPVPNAESKGWATNPRLLAFDIECYSSNHKAMPNQLHALHVVYMISLIYQRANDPSSRKRFGIVLGDCDDVQMDESRPGPPPKEGETQKMDPILGDRNVTIIRVKTEIELINEMSRITQELDPEILLGYNILSFDYPYMDARLKRRLHDWKPMGRILNRSPVMKSKEWRSDAYGYNSINILQMDGRISIDMLPLVKRDYKLDKYDLDFVSKYFLGQHRGKHDIKAQEMFRIYEESQTAKKTQTENPERYLQARNQMTRVMKYCVEDSELVIDLFEKLNIWIGLVELSNIVGVSIMDLFTRGQQVRCLSQIYDLAARQGYVIDARENIPVRFSGGFVYDPIPGLYENIICLDFASLYPSIMQAFNICLTTLVPPEMMDEIPDRDCHVFDFDQEEDEVTAAEGEEEHNPDEEVADAQEAPKKKGKKTVHRHYKFIKQATHEGILPQLVRNLVAERRAVRELLDGKKDATTGEWIVKKETDATTRVVLDKRQWALKITANSFFGFLGVQDGGKLPLIEGAMCITAKGRELINYVQNYIRKTHNAEIVYGDTDSCMVDLHIQDPKECNEWGHRLSVEISALFPPPLKMEFEKGMRKFLLLQKKMYIYSLVDKDGGQKKDDQGKVILVKKGIAEARRDRCKWFRKVSDTTIRTVFSEPKVPIEDTLDIIVDLVKDLLEARVPYKELISIRELGAHYKSENYFVKVFADNLRRLGKIVNPGDRLEFVFVRTPNPNDRAGMKMRSPEVYLERQGTPEEEQIDYVYYLEHMLMGPIDKLFYTGYKKELEALQNIGYKPNGRYHFKSIDEPIKMMIRIIADGKDIGNIKKMLRPQDINVNTNIKPKLRLNIVDVNAPVVEQPLQAQQVKTPPRLKIVNPEPLVFS